MNQQGVPQQFWQALDHLTIGEVASPDVLSVYEGWSLKRLATFFAKHHVSGAPVMAADHTLIGVVTQADLVEFEARDISDAEVQKILEHNYGPNAHGLTESDLKHLKERSLETCTINGIMTSKVVSSERAEPASTACRKMVDQDIHRLFITENGKIVGVVTAMDILRYFSSSAEAVSA